MLGVVVPSSHCGGNQLSQHVVLWLVVGAPEKVLAARSPLSPGVHPGIRDLCRNMGFTGRGRNRYVKQTKVTVSCPGSPFVTRVLASAGYRLAQEWL